MAAPVVNHAEQNHVASTHGIIKALRDQRYCDLTITCRDEVFYVHKVVVCSASSFFEKALGFQCGKEAKESRIDLPEDDPEMIRRLMTFFYVSDYAPIAMRSGAIQDTPFWRSRDSQEFSPHRHPRGDCHKPSLFQAHSNECGCLCECLEYIPEDVEFDQPVEQPPSSQPDKSIFSAALSNRQPTPSTQSGLSLFASAQPSMQTNLLQPNQAGPSLQQSNRSGNSLFGQSNGHPPPSTPSNRPQLLPQFTGFQSIPDQAVESSSSSAPSKDSVKLPDLCQKNMAQVHPLSIHACMYALGDKYGVKGLSEVARRKFRSCLNRHWDTDDFIEAVQIVYTSTPSLDRGLRYEIVQAFRKFFKVDLMQISNAEENLTKFNKAGFTLLKGCVTQNGLQNISKG